jgi:hypothetical protein
MAERIDVGLPEGLDVVDHGSHVELVLKWFSWKIAAMTGFAILWDAFLINWYTRVAPGADPMATYFPLIHVALGLGVTYYVIAGWCNRTRILVGQGKVAIRHSPIPWFGNIEIDSSNLKQVYTQERVGRSRRGNDHTTYEVRAVTEDGRNMKLLGGLETSEQALSIEHQIEKHLRIRDVPVIGEMATTR